MTVYSEAKRDFILGENNWKDDKESYDSRQSILSFSVSQLSMAILFGGCVEEHFKV